MKLFITQPSLRDISHCLCLLFMANKNTVVFRGRRQCRAVRPHLDGLLLLPLPRHRPPLPLYVCQGPQVAYC